MAAGASSGAAAAAAAIAQAIRASGAIVRIYPQDFLAILSRNMGALSGAVSWRNSLLQVRVSQTMLQLPNNIELITADKIWIPA